jgi:terminase small subunit-like protein
MGTKDINPALSVPEDFQCGPAMRKLNDRQRAFVTAILDFGGRNNTRAAMAAGYEGEPHVLKVTAFKLAHSPNIQDAIREEAQNRLNGSSIMAVNILLDIAEDVTTEKKDRLKACEMIMNRTGLIAKTEHTVNITKKDLTSDEMLKRIHLLSNHLGIDPAKLLGGPAVDVEYVEVPAAEDDLLDLLGAPPAEEDDLGDLL